MKQLTGKTIFDADSKAFNYTEEDIQNCLDLVKSLYDNNVCAPASYSSAYSNDDLQSDPNWIAGKYVCTFAYISTINVMTAANEGATYGTGYLPCWTALRTTAGLATARRSWQLPPPARLRKQP